MKIRTQFILTPLLFGIIVIIIAASVIITNQGVDLLDSQQTLANKILQQANDLSYLSNDYLLHQESQQPVRWESLFASFSADLANLNPGSPEQQTLVNNIKADQQRLQAVFNDVKSAVGNSPQDQNAATSNLVFIQVSWSRMEVQNRGIISDASRLVQILHAQIDRLKQTNITLIFVLIGLFVGFLIIDFFVINQRLLKSISVLQTGTKIVGSGNLDYHITAREKDEIGELSRAFNQMTADLKGVTASKAELEKEITERKKAEAEIVHLATFPELNPTPILEMNAVGDIQYLNPSAKEQFPDLAAQGNKHPFLVDWESVVSQLQTEEKPMLRREIKIGDFWYEQTVSYVTSNQSVRFYGSDITKRIRAEEELKRYAAELETSNKELESFSYSVSHDLRAPLRSMDGFSRAVLEDYGDKLDEQGKNYLDRIRASSQLMAQLIDDILGLSRVVRAELKLKKTNLSDEARSISERLNSTHPERKVEFNITPDIEAFGDENLLHLVLENLLGNAFKFTVNRQLALIEFSTCQKDGQKVYFVRDNGVGFDMTYVDKLFKPFQRLHTNKDFPGTGIGLATVQRIINRHGGKVWAEGEQGKGSTFYFTLGRKED